jgi:uncharacterized phage-associated protein
LLDGVSEGILSQRNKSGTKVTPIGDSLMAYDVRAVANLVLDLAEHLGVDVTNITINKIIFFLHGWYLTKTGEPLVSAKIEAWDYGPVFRELYVEFKQFGSKPISTRAMRRNPSTAEKETCVGNFTEHDLGFLRPLIEKYVVLSAGKLVELSHVRGGPWDQVYNHPGESNPGMRISDELIRQYFRAQTRH